MKKLFLITALLGGASVLFAQEYKAINPAFMDLQVRPQDDFYNYVNGNWMKTVEIP